MNLPIDQTIKIDVEHLARVEGHGNIKIRIEKGQLKECSWEVVETPRFFEKMFQGLSIDVAPLLAARVCGICSISHALSSARAIERGLGIEIPDMARKVRLLAKQRGVSLGTVVTELIRNALSPGKSEAVRNGVPIFPVPEGPAPDLELVNKLRD